MRNLLLSIVVILVILTGTPAEALIVDVTSVYLGPYGGEYEADNDSISASGFEAYEMRARTWFMSSYEEIPTTGRIIPEWDYFDHPLDKQSDGTVKIVFQILDENNPNASGPADVWISGSATASYEIASSTSSDILSVEGGWALVRDIGGDPGSDTVNPKLEARADASTDPIVRDTIDWSLTSLEIGRPYEVEYRTFFVSPEILLYAFFPSSFENADAMNDWIETYGDTGTLQYRLSAYVDWNLSLLDPNSSGGPPGGDGTAPVPEPTTILLLGTGLVGLAGYSRKKFFKK